MESSCGRYVIVFNGEMYNFRSLRPELEQRGIAFRGSSDTEVLLGAMTCWGVRGALERANGMFALAVWDREARSLTLARDRLGEKPLYYGIVGSTFAFGSELKALRVHPRFAPELDRGALSLYLRHSYVPAPHSIWRGISKLPPACMLTVSSDLQPAVTEYWSARTVAERGSSEPFRGSDEDAVDALDELLSDAVRLRMEADVPLGAFLSGGIDSSTIVALMQAQGGPPARTFTIGFHESRYNEAEYAKAVAHHLGTEHTELYVTPTEARDVVPRLPRVFDEPFGDSSQIPTLLVSELARRHVTVALSGDGGDELFGGYNRYFWAPRIWSRTQRIPRVARRSIGTALGLRTPAQWNAMAGRVARALPRRLRSENVGARLHQLADLLTIGSEDASYHRVVSHWTDPAAVVVGGSEPSTTLTDPACRPDLDDFVERMMYLDLVTYLPDDILVKTDRATMAVSLEGRVPLLDHRVVELAWRLPMHLRIDGDVQKVALRRVLARHVPTSLVDRSKMGFGVPIDEWLRGPLRPWADELLSETRLRAEGYFDPAPIRATWDEHLAGRRDRHFLLWDVLMFQAWLEAQR
jgi:asparagine synthase (glutamine-hydrolysing)